MAADRSHVAYKEAPAMDNGHDDSVMIAKSPAHKRRRLYLAIIFMILLLIILLASVFLLGLLLTGGLSSALNTSYKPTLRLTDHVTPQTYWWDVRVNVPTKRVPMKLDQIGTIQANLTVLLRINKPTYVVFMHSHNLTIDQDSVRIRNFNQTDMQVKLENITHFPEVQQVRFEFDQILLEDNDYVLEVLYSAPFSKGLNGLYMIEYTEDGSKK